MKFTCNTKNLNDACANVMRAVSTKVSIQTIEGILIECGSETLSLTGYDFEFGINTTLTATVSEPGAIVINGKIFCDIIRKLSSESITVETNGTSVLITSGAAQYNITGIDAEEYPELPSVQGGYPLFINQSVFSKWLCRLFLPLRRARHQSPFIRGLNLK